MRYKRWILLTLIALVVAVTFSGAAYAISMFTKEVAGLGKMTFTDEVEILDIKVKCLSKVKVKLESKASTQADYAYTTWLYLDDEKWPVGKTVSWTAGQIPGHKKKVTFTGLDLSAVTDVDAEVVK